MSLLYSNPNPSIEYKSYKNSKIKRCQVCQKQLSGQSVFATICLECFGLKIKSNIKKYVSFAYSVHQIIGLISNNVPASDNALTCIFCGEGLDLENGNNMICENCLKKPIDETRINYFKKTVLNPFV